MCLRNTHVQNSGCHNIVKSVNYTIFFAYSRQRNKNQQFNTKYNKIKHSYDATQTLILPPPKTLAERNLGQGNIKVCATSQ